MKDKIKIMKEKIALILLFVFLIGMIASCKSEERCAAYGEAKKYQVEKRQ
ncbi:MAG TPA: hypothetical protein PK028_00900 [Bacteroidales bacterium]|nr:hypothetical protein [Bacteroidales bacterium]MDI9573777.1 hypothetical protein [Bacteroidota bacterium]OQC61283.1 MAG: hypothetical protein BWX51_00461 [Bacteroidetes bacterium ADurb.Bin012]MBP9511112.1 hypothetical protein [Bacteroidales bacterium]MBP9588607.1 hypothetical protein [Bacteroidales bacterium]